VIGAYYNEHDPFAAAWLRGLVREGLIAAGDVDERSITDVTVDDVRGYAQAHFFAGIGGWSYALRLAKWPDDRPVWTGSCPCQPFSVAGAGAGEDDPRHLWPEFFRLIRDGRPATVFGEQVASADGRLWLAGVRADLAGVGYRFGAADLCAAGIGAPHIRQRLYWVADSASRGLGIDGGAPGRTGHIDECREVGRMANARSYECGTRRDAGTNAGRASEPTGLRPDGGMVDPDSLGSGPGQNAERREAGCGADRSHDRLGDPCGAGLEERFGVGGMGQVADRSIEGQPAVLPGSCCSRLGDAERDGLRSGGRAEPNEPDKPGHWALSGAVLCADGKPRRVPLEPAFSPLVDGLSAERVGVLRGAGNAIVPPLAAEFVGAYMDLLGNAVCPDVAEAVVRTTMEVA